MIRSRLCRVISLLGCTLTIGICGAGFGQTPVSSPPATQAAPAAAPLLLPQTPVVRANSSLVLVDVVVVDRGKPVHALDRSRFHIFQDGHEQALTSFDEHQADEQKPAAPNRMKLPPNTFSNAPTYPDTGVVNVLLLDALNTPVASQLVVRQQMTQYLGKIKPGTMLAIYTLASRLRMVQGFTTDASMLAKALESGRAAAQSSVALRTDNDQASDDQLIDTMTDGGASADSIASMQQFMADTAAFQTDVRVGMTLDALNELARSLSGIPGRKNLIWFSGSFPIALDPDDTLKSPFEAMRNYGDQVQQTSELLSAARVAVYPVDARGLMTSPTFQASYKSSGNAARGGNFMRDNNRFTQQTNNEQSTMMQIAQQTGGQEYVNTNGLAEAVASAVENGSDYYTVGYVPPAGKPDGHFHKIQVKLDGASYRLAYRRGYYADTDGKTPGHDPGKPALVAQAVMDGAPLATQILFEAQVRKADDPELEGAKLPAGPAGAMSATLNGPVSRYVAQLRIDPKGIRFEDTPEGTHKATVELALIAYDEQGKRVNYFDRAVTINLEQAQYARVMGGKIPVLIALDLPAGRLQLRMMVLDLTAGRAGSLEVPLQVSAKAKGKAGS